MIKKLLNSISVLAFLLISSTVLAQLTLPRNPSPAAEVSQTVGITEISINYSRPSVIAPNGQDRTGNIWGQIVPFGWSDPLPAFGSGNKFPWRAGANENTVITFSDDVKVEGKNLVAGSYGLHLLVNEDGSATWIFSSNSSSWGSYFYNEVEDILRVKVRSEDHEQTPRLSYSFNELSGNGTIIALDWEKKRFPLKVEVDTHSVVMASMSDQLRSSTGFNWQNYVQAASYSLGNNVGLEQGLKWADAAMTSNPNFTTMSTKSALLTRMGKEDEGSKLMQTALDDPTATITDYYNYGRQLIGQDKDAEALNIYQKLNKRWPDNWLAPHGLARAYSAMGDYKKALKYERVALKGAPATSKGFLEGFVKLLEEGKDFN